LWGHFLHYNCFIQIIAKSVVAKFWKQYVDTTQCAQRRRNQIPKIFFRLLITSIHYRHDWANTFKHKETEPNHVPVTVLIYGEISSRRLDEVSGSELVEAVDRDGADGEDDHGDSEDEGKTEALDLPNPRERCKDADYHQWDEQVSQLAASWVKVVFYPIVKSAVNWFDNKS
jgi:hypothetical protein